jgi:hypothetical protein
VCECVSVCVCVFVCVCVRARAHECVHMSLSKEAINPHLLPHISLIETRHSRAPGVYIANL